MDAKLKIFAMLLFFCLCNGGDAMSSLSDLAFTQTSVAGQQIGGYPEYLVTVENRCVCTQTDVKLACPGFNTSIHVDPAGIIRRDADGKLCTLNGRGPVRSGDVIEFHYAWSTRFSFAPSPTASPAREP